MTAPAEPDRRFLRACLRLDVDRTPVWFMRQAGRSLAAFRELRERWSFFDLVKTPELAAEVTAMPVRRLGVDAAILFSDIVVPLEAIGVPVRIEAGVGPVFDEPFRSEADLARIRPLEPGDAPWLGEAVKAVAAAVDVPVIGFAGAPFTVASYLVEGGPSRTFTRTLSLMHGEPALFARLLDALAGLALSSLKLQVEAGADAVQLFDSWAGALAPDDYRRYVLPATKRVISGLAEMGVPRILFGVNTGELLGAMAEAGPEVVGVDHHVHIDSAWDRVGSERAVQGNLDPAICLAPWPVVEARARDVISRVAGRPGHIFNLGHGVLPETDPDVLERLVDLVHSETAT